jgi:hypothetical protein
MATLGVKDLPAGPFDARGLTGPAVKADLLLCGDEYEIRAELRAASRGIEGRRTIHQRR